MSIGTFVKGKTVRAAFAATLMVVFGGASAWAAKDPLVPGPAKVDPVRQAAWKAANSQAKGKIDRFDAAVKSGNPDGIRQATLELQADPIAVQQLNNSGRKDLVQRHNAETQTIKDATKQNIKKDMADKWNAENPHDPITLDDVDVAEPTNYKKPDAEPRVGQDWDVTVKVRGKDVPTSTSQGVVEDSYFKAAGGEKTFGKGTTPKDAAHKQAVEVTDSSSLESYKEPDKILGTKEAPPDAGSRVKDPQDLGNVIEYKSNLARNKADAARAAGNPVEAARQDFEQMRQAVKQYDKITDPRVKAQGGKVGTQVDAGMQVMRDVANMKISPEEGRALLAAMGETPDSITRKAAGQVEAAQKLKPPEAPKTTAPDAPKGVVPDAPKGVVPDAPKGVVPDAPKGVVPDAPKGVIPDAPKGIVPDAPKGIVPDAPKGIVPDAPKGVVPDAPKGLVPDAPKGVVPDAPKGVVPDAPKGVVPDAPKGVVPDAPRGVVPDAPKGVVPDAPKGVVPDAPKGVIPDAPKGVVPDAPKGVVPDAPKGVVPDAPKGVIPDAPKGVVPDAPKGVVPDAPKGVVPDAPKGVVPDAPKGVVPDAPKGVVPDSPKGVIPDAPKGVVPDAPKGIVPDAPKGVVPDAPKVTTPDAPKGVVPDAPKVAAPDAPKAATPDVPSGKVGKALKGLNTVGDAVDVFGNAQDFKEAAKKGDTEGMKNAAVNTADSLTGGFYGTTKVVGGRATAAGEYVEEVSDLDKTMENARQGQITGDLRKAGYTKEQADKMVSDLAAGNDSAVKDAYEKMGKEVPKPETAAPSTVGEAAGIYVDEVKENLGEVATGLKTQAGKAGTFIKETASDVTEIAGGMTEKGVAGEVITQVGENVSSDNLGAGYDAWEQNTKAGQTTEEGRKALEDRFVARGATRAEAKDAADRSYGIGTADGKSDKTGLADLNKKLRDRQKSKLKNEGKSDGGDDDDDEDDEEGGGGLKGFKGKRDTRTGENAESSYGLMGENENLSQASKKGDRAAADAKQTVSAAGADAQAIKDKAAAAKAAADREQGLGKAIADGVEEGVKTGASSFGSSFGKTAGGHLSDQIFDDNKKGDGKGKGGGKGGGEGVAGGSGGAGSGGGKTASKGSGKSGGKKGKSGGGKSGGGAEAPGDSAPEQSATPPKPKTKQVKCCLGCGGELTYKGIYYADGTEMYSCGACKSTVHDVGTGTPWTVKEVPDVETPPAPTGGTPPAVGGATGTSAASSAPTAGTGAAATSGGTSGAGTGGAAGAASPPAVQTP